MPEQTVKFVKENWLTLANFIILVSLVFRLGYATSNIDSSIENHSEKIEKNRVDIFMHRTDVESHMPYEKSSTLFVPRIEIDSRLTSIEKSLERIEKNQKRN